MRSSIRQAEKVRMPLLALVLILATACSVPVAAVSSDDHSTDAGEIHRASLFPVEDRSMDAIEAQRGWAYPH